MGGDMDAEARLAALASMATTCRTARAGARTLPPDEADLLSKDKTMEIRLAIAGRSGIPVETVRRLAGDAYAAVRRRIARRMDLPEDVLSALCADTSKHVRLAVADDGVFGVFGRSLPAEGRRRLLDDPDLDVLVAMAGRADLSDDEIRLLADGGGGAPVLRALASRHSLSHDCAEFLALKGEKESLLALAGKSPVSEGTARAILAFGDWKARRRLAIQPPDSFSLRVRAALALDGAFAVPLHLLDGTDDAPTLLFLALSPHPSIRAGAVSKAGKASAHEILEALEEASALHPRRRKRLAAAAKEILAATKR